MKVVVYPDPILDRPCDDVTGFDIGLNHLVDDMAEAMYASAGVGLAAPQIGLSKNIILVDPSAGDQGNQLLVMINPIIHSASLEQTWAEEGCLSLPGVFLSVSRSTVIDVKYYDVMGNAKRIACSDWQARIVQHEVEHLMGITMLRKAGPLARKMALKNLSPNGC